MTAPKYPDVRVRLTTGDPEGWQLIMRVYFALAKSGHYVAAREWLAEAGACPTYEDLSRLAADTVEVW